MKTFLLVSTLLAAVYTTGFAQKQGICGKVVWTSGNQMPGPGLKSSSPTGIVREVYIYEATLSTQATQIDGFYSGVQTKLLKIVKTKKDGSFSVKLPAGTYSLFVKEAKGLWANTFDGKGIINPATVTAKTCTMLTLNVNYDAAY